MLLHIIGLSIVIAYLIKLNFEVCWSGAVMSGSLLVDPVYTAYCVGLYLFIQSSSSIALVLIILCKVTFYFAGEPLYI